MRAILACLVVIVALGCGGDAPTDTEEQSPLGEFQYALSGVRGKGLPATVDMAPCGQGDTVQVTVDTATFTLAFASSDSSHGDMRLDLSGAEHGCDGSSGDVSVSATGSWQIVNWDSIATSWETGSVRFTRLDVNTNDPYFISGGTSFFLTGYFAWDLPVTSVRSPDTTAHALAGFVASP